MSKVFFYKDKAYELNYDFGDGIKILIPKEIYLKKELSAGARVLLAYIFSLPKGWHLRLENLAETLGFSRQSVAKYLKEIYALNLNAFKEIEAREYEVQTHDLKSGVYEISAEFMSESVALDEKAQVEEYIAQNTSKYADNVAKVRVFQTQRQKYLLYLAFNAWHLESSVDLNGNLSPKANARKNAENVKNFNTNIKLDKSNFKILEQRPRETKLDSKAHCLKAKNSDCENLESEKDISLTLNMTKQKSANDDKKPRGRAKNIIDLLDLSEFKTLTYDLRDIVKDWLEYKQEFHNCFLKPKQIDFQLNRIRKFIAQGADVRAIIEQSINRGYQGLFEVKEPSLNPRGFSQTQARYREQNYSDAVKKSLAMLDALDKKEAAANAL